MTEIIDYESKFNSMKKQRDNVMKKFTAEQQKYEELEDKHENLKSVHKDYKLDYKNCCNERNKLDLAMEKSGWSKDRNIQFTKFKDFYNKNNGEEVIQQQKSDCPLLKRAYALIEKHTTEIRELKHKQSNPNDNSKNIISGLNMTIAKKDIEIKEFKEEIDLIKEINESQHKLIENVEDLKKKIVNLQAIEVLNDRIIEENYELEDDFDKLTEKMEKMEEDIALNKEINDLHEISDVIELEKRSMETQTDNDSEDNIDLFSNDDKLYDYNAKINNLSITYNKEITDKTLKNIWGDKFKKTPDNMKISSRLFSHRNAMIKSLNGEKEMKDQKIDYSAHYLKIIIEANNHITELSEEKEILVQKLIYA